MDAQPTWQTKFVMRVHSPELEQFIATLKAPALQYRPEVGDEVRTCLDRHEVTNVMLRPEYSVVIVYLDDTYISRDFEKCKESLRSLGWTIAADTKT